MRHEIRVAGFGGQGMILAGLLIGKAAALYDGKEAVFTQSYGPEARGGASNADVIISDEPIDYPLVTRPDHFVAMFQEAYERYRPMMVEGGVLLLESDLVKPSPDEGPYRGIPATRIAEELGRRIVANVVMVGFFSGATGLISPEAGEQSIRNTLRPRLVDLNLKAFHAGYDYAKKQEAS
ncbi:MAG: 2-oxoacid:acceptor oxidoreductase family protein [Dehalococcoidia bacterium]